MKNSVSADVGPLVEPSRASGTYQNLLRSRALFSSGNDRSAGERRSASMNLFPPVLKCIFYAADIRLPCNERRGRNHSPASSSASKLYPAACGDLAVQPRSQSQAVRVGPRSLPWCRHCQGQKAGPSDPSLWRGCKRGASTIYAQQFKHVGASFNKVFPLSMLTCRQLEGEVTGDEQRPQNLSWIIVSWTNGPSFTSRE